MKRRDLIKKLTDNGWWLARHGSKHDIYTNGIRSESISRQIDINERLAKKILGRAEIK